MANKIIDINSTYGGASDDANQLNYDVLIDKYKPLRTPKINVKRLFKPTDVKKLPEFIINTYKIKGLEFGNWVNQVRRLDYCLSTIIAFFDLQKILQLKNNNLGLNKSVSMAYGARGAAGALAHYEPSTKVINLSRDRRIDKIKNLFGNKVYAPYTETDQNNWDKLTNKIREDISGYGSIAHEYGHALDYILAEKYTKQRSTALSGGAVSLTSYKNANLAYSNFLDRVYNRKENINELEKAFIDAFEPFLFTKDKPTGFYRRVYDFAEKKKSDYWSRNNEIWARIFETYIAYKLEKTGIKDNYLVRAGKGKYRIELGKDAYNVYPTFGEMAKNYKKIDNFVKTINNFI
jgi:hypothetical protein